MRKILVLLLLLILLMNGCSRNLNIPLTEKLPPQIESCEKTGGFWKSFPNTCVDSCSYVRSKERIMCGQAFTDGCDCGPDKCWNGKSCEIN